MSLPLAYLCVPGWAEGSAGTTVGTMTATGGTVTRGDAAASRSLGDFTEIAASSATVTASVDLAIKPSDASLSGQYVVALIGVRITPLDRDVVLRCKMTANGVDYFSAATIYCQQMDRSLPASTEGHQLFGSGLANLIFHNLPHTAITSGVDFEMVLDGGPSLSSKTVYIGSVFAGLEIPLKMDANSVQIGTQIANDRNTKRSGGDLSSDGVLLRSLQLEARQMPLEVLSGISGDYYSSSSEYVGPNIMRAAIANVGAPMLLSLYPYALPSAAWSGSPDADEIQERSLSRRQNFFSLYGLLDRQIDVNTDEQQGQGLSALYRTRLRFGEIR